MVAIGWLALALEITNRVPTTRRVLAGALGYLAAGQSLVWTNSIHHLVLGTETRLTGTILVPTYGPGFWVFSAFAYAYALAGIGVVRLGIEAAQTTGIRRRQTTLLALAAVPAVVANVASIAFVASVPYGFTPFGYLLTIAVFAVARLRNPFLELSSVARRRVVSEVDERIVTLDGQDRVVDCNAAARRLFGADEFRAGMPAAEFFSAAGPEFAEALLRVDADVDSHELTARVGDGWRTFLASVTLLEGRVQPGRVVVLREITSLKRRERQLRQQNERLDRFASIISHDIRNPIHVLKGNLSLIEESEDIDRVKPANWAVERIERITEELLEVARTGVLVEETESVPLAKTAREAWQTTRREEATLECAFSDKVEVVTDRDRLVQLFENLFRNAVEHNDPDGLAVRVGPLPRSDRSGSSPDGFFIADDGTGISPDECEDVFEHGYTTSDDGTGLGLFIVESIVSAHRWEITAAESRTGGAQFDICKVQFNGSDRDA